MNQSKRPVWLLVVVVFHAEFFCNGDFARAFLTNQGSSCTMLTSPVEGGTWTFSRHATILRMLNVAQSNLLSTDGSTITPPSDKEQAFFIRTGKRFEPSTVSANMETPLLHMEGITSEKFEDSAASTFPSSLVHPRYLTYTEHLPQPAITE